MNSLFDKEALEGFRENWKGTINDKGGHCPVCDRWGMVNKRCFNKTMAKSLVWLTHQGNDYIDVPGTAPVFVLKTNQLASCRWWGLTERPPSDDDTKKHSGHWRATPRGRAFVDGGLTIPKYVLTYAGEPISFSVDERIFIFDAVSKFDYREAIGS